MGTYSGQSGGETVTIEIATSPPTDPGFKHNVRIKVPSPKWDYVASCKGQNSSVMDVVPNISGGTTVTNWTVTDGASGKVHVRDAGSGSDDPSTGFNGDLTPQ
jgi:hypothetical protein